MKGDSTERDALIALYNSTNGDNWLKKTGWLGAAGTECDWFGIDCSDGQVQNIFLSSNNLSGVLPKELNTFSKLNTFVVGDNSITGSLSALSGMSTLRNLDLRNNLFSGTIPRSLLVLGMPTFITIGNEGLANVLPIASISGGSRSVKDTDGVAGESVNFTGTIFDHEFSGNNKAYKIPITTEWLVNGSVFSSEPGKNSTSYKIDLNLVDGTNTVVLRVTDHQKAIATDTVIITVGKKSVSPPVQLTPSGATATQLGGVDPDKTGTLTSDQLGKLDASAVSSFDKNQIADLDPVAVAGLSADQVKVIDTVAIGGFNKEQISKLSQSAISGLTTDQFDKIAPAVLNGLTKDNLGGLGSKVIGNITPEMLSNLNIDAVKGMATEEFSKFITNLDSTKITTDNVDGLLPSGWTLEASGQLKAPPGAKLAFKTLEKVTNINNTSLPTLPDLSKSFSLGGGGSGSILDGLDKAIDSSNIGYNFYQRSDGILNLRAIDASLDLTPAAAFLPDTSEMKQAPKNSVPGIGVDSRGAYVLITDKGYSIPLLPALINPDAVKNLLPVTSEIEIGSGGQTTISDLGDGRGNAVAGVPNPLVSTSIKSAGIYSIGSGAKEKIEIVQADGSLQVISPAFKDQDGLITALYAIPEVAGVEINTDGTVDLIYNGSSLILKPHFDVEVKEGGGKYLAGIIQDNGKFYFTNAKGERQQFN